MRRVGSLRAKGLTMMDDGGGGWFTQGGGEEGDGEDGWLASGIW